ncbi:hypothetical protein BKA66DRAFT_130515 [Pyrenochaeta sp. MPI-SDFR-AT-0127]|nr:hypothetical protein BKA66DRAFT_130515 [Pyrenochaeta sp. MPI-SDFR-AT-0127]
MSVIQNLLISDFPFGPRTTACERRSTETIILIFHKIYTSCLFLRVVRVLLGVMKTSRSLILALLIPPLVSWILCVAHVLPHKQRGTYERQLPFVSCDPGKRKSQNKSCTSLCTSRMIIVHCM